MANGLNRLLGLSTYWGEFYNFLEMYFNVYVNSWHLLVHKVAVYSKNYHHPTSPLSHCISSYFWFQMHELPYQLYEAFHKTILETFELRSQLLHFLM